MKKIILLIFLISIPVFSAWNPSWVEVVPNRNVVCTGSNELVTLSATFQNADPETYSTVNFELAGIPSGDITAIAPPDPTIWSVDITNQPPGIYYATASIGTAQLITEDTYRKVTLIDIQLEQVDQVQFDEYTSFEVTILPEDANIPVGLHIFRTSGNAGMAEFESGGQTKTITATSIVWIKGTVESDPDIPNLELSAEVDNFLCQAVNFKAVDCAGKFNGVTFTWTDKDGNALKGHDELAAILAANFVYTPAVNNKKFIQWKTAKPAIYTPKITIQTPNDDDEKAKEFRVGLAQNYVGSTTKYTYAYDIQKLRLKTETTKVPVKDGVEFVKVNWHNLFVQINDPTKLSAFTGDNTSVQLTHDDKPEGAPWGITAYDPSYAVTFDDNVVNLLTKIVVKNKFITWVVVEHIESKCFKKLHHIEWEMDYLVNVTWNAQTFVPHLLLLRMIFW